jgi:hypothetical protein
VGGEVLLDQRVRRAGSHHQKPVVIRGAGRDVAFAGGIDLCHSRRDDADHHGDPQTVPMAAAYGDRPPRHDVQLELRGPVVGLLDDVFRERWTDPRSLDTDNPISYLEDRLRHVDLTPDPLPARPPDPEPAGPCAVQVLRTYPAIRPRTPYAPHGERSVARGYAKAFRRARRLIYLEDQYTWSPHIAGLLADALRRHPGLHLVVVVPRHPDVDGRLALPPNQVGRLEALRVTQRAAPDRVHVFDLENHAGTPVYVHAKLCVIDDVWACTGSANLNRRSWSHDSELSCAVLDDTPDEREAPRPRRPRRRRPPLRPRPAAAAAARAPRPGTGRRRGPARPGTRRWPPSARRRTGWTRGTAVGGWARAHPDDCDRTAPRSCRRGRAGGRSRCTAWSTTRTGDPCATACAAAGRSPARLDRPGGHEPRAGPSLADADVRGLRQPRGRRRLGDLAGLDVARAARLRRQHPDHAVVGQRADGVDQRVHQIAVVLAPPQQDQVDDLVSVLVEQLVTATFLDGVPYGLVDVVVPPELLDDHPRLHAELARDVGQAPGILRGSHACTPFPRTDRRRPLGPPDAASEHVD